MGAVEAAVTMNEDADIANATSAAASVVVQSPRWISTRTKSLLLVAPTATLASSGAALSPLDCVGTAEEPPFSNPVWAIAGGGTGENAVRALVDGYVRV